jgi:hypothetical protein
MLPKELARLGDYPIAATVGYGPRLGIGQFYPFVETQITPFGNSLDRQRGSFAPHFHMASNPNTLAR